MPTLQSFMFIVVILSSVFTLSLWFDASSSAFVVFSVVLCSHTSSIVLFVLSMIVFEELLADLAVSPSLGDCLLSMVIGVFVLSCGLGISLLYLSVVCLVLLWLWVSFFNSVGGILLLGSFVSV